MESKENNKSPQDEAARILVEFLEVAITSVVFLKEIYPSGAFERRRYMNLVVHRAKHPQLREYINSAVTGLKLLLQKGLVDRVAVTFSDANNIPLEKFTFKLNLDLSYDSKLKEADLASFFRSFLIKLPASESLTKVVPKDCRWEITSYFRSLPQSGTSNEAELWILTRMKQWQQASLITPVKSISREPFSVQLYLEHPNESAPKT